MKAKSIYEFHKHQDPRATLLKTSIEEIEKWLVSKDISYNPLWLSPQDLEDMELYFNDIIMPNILFVHSLGVPFKEMTLTSPTNLYLNGWELRAGNRVVGNFLTKKDAEAVKEVFEDFTPGDGNFHIEKGDFSSVSLTWPKELASKKYNKSTFERMKEFLLGDSIESLKKIKKARKKYKI